MFELEKAIADWRRQMTVGGVAGTRVLDELECHLRDDMERRVGSGVSAEDAFASSLECLGQPEILRTEFDKNGAMDSVREQVRRAFFTLAGIPNSYLEPNMNTLISNPNPEPRWASYTKAAVFVAPAIALWTFSVIFLFPKLQQICREAGVAIPSVYEMTQLIANHTVLFCAAPVLLFGFLEWRFRRWPNYRRAALGTTVFVLNAAILALITWMVVIALLAAPHLMHHA